MLTFIHYKLSSVGSVYFKILNIHNFSMGFETHIDGPHVRFRAFEGSPRAWTVCSVYIVMEWMWAL